MSRREDLKRGYKVLSVDKAAKDLSIELETLFEYSKKEQCWFFIEIPDSVKVYIRGEDQNRHRVRRNRINRDGIKEADHGPLIQVNNEMEFLCLSPSACKPLLHKEIIRKKEFDGVGLMRSSGIVENYTTHEYTRRYTDRRHKTVNLWGSFLTFQIDRDDHNVTDGSIQPTIESSISIRIEELQISIEDLNKIKASHKTTGPDFGKLKRQPWTSEMLCDLNEASTIFCSGGSEVKPEEVREWFKNKWKRVSSAPALIEQATFAILPDDQYHLAPNKRIVEESTANQYNEYTSTALIIINEAAKKFWKQVDPGKHKGRYAKNQEIIKYLSEEKKLTKRLSIYSARIIRSK